jgi:uncharacterized membrane protein YqhA
MFFNRLLALTRYIILIPVVGAWIAALLTIGFGGYEIVLTIFLIPAGAGDKALKGLVLNLIEGVDLFLLGTAFYLISLGLYELFVNDDAPLPPWLVIRNLDDLKNKLLKVLVVVLAVQFLSQVLAWKSGVDILYLGSAVALVVLAVAYFIGQRAKENH